MILIKGDTFEKGIDARFLMAETDVSKCHFLLLPVPVFIPRINGKIFSTTDLSTAYHQVALTPETEKPIYWLLEMNNTNVNVDFMIWNVSLGFSGK